MTRLIPTGGLAIFLAWAVGGQTPTKEFIYLGGRLVAIEQTGPNLTVSPNAVSAVAGTSTATVTVTAGVGVAWSSTTAETWISFSGASSGTGGGSVTLAIAANPNPAPRQGAVQIGGAVVTVTQAAGSAATGATMSPGSMAIPLSGGVYYVAVNSTSAWTATASETWIVFQGATSGSGNGLLSFTVAATGAFRKATITAGGATTYVYQGASTTPPVLVTPNPLSGGGTSGLFDFVASDAIDGGYVSSIQVLFNYNLDGRDACFLYLTSYDRRFYLMNDAGTAWTHDALESGATLENSQCAVNLAASTMTVDGPTKQLRYKVQITFKPIFTGVKQFWMLANNHSGAMSNGWWAQRGTWTAYGAPAAPQVPSNVSMNPTAGSGSSGTLTFRHKVQGGTAQDFFDGRILINTAIDPRGCYVLYHRSSRMIYLLNDASGIIGGAPAGTAGAFYDSPYCTLYVSDSSMAEDGEELVVTIRVDFKPAVAGTPWTAAVKNVYYTAMDRAARHTNWNGSFIAAGGTWDNAGAMPIITNTAVEPYSSNGAVTTYEARAYVSTGASAVTWTEIGFGPNGIDFRDACVVSYNKASGEVRLSKDGFSWENGVWWLETTGTLGSQTVLENAQCKLHLASSSDASATNTFRLRLAIQFTPLFAGNKEIYQITWVGGQSNPGGYEKMGDITFGPIPPMPPPVSVTPSVGSGTSQIFTFKSTTGLGANFIHSTVWNFDTTYNSGAPSCKILVHRSSRRVHLFDNATFSDYGWVGDSTRPTVSNTNCSLNLAAATMVVSPGQSGATTTLDVNMPITFPANWGAKNIWMRTLDKAMQFPNAVDMGDWTVGSVTAPVTASPTFHEVSEVGTAGQSKSFTITTTGSWRIVYDNTLITVADAASGATGSGNRTFVYSVVANYGLPRTIPIQIKSFDGTAVLAVHNVVQAGKPVCQVSPALSEVGVGQTLSFNAYIGNQPASALGYSVVWGLYLTPSGAQTAGAGYGNIGPNGDYNTIGAANGNTAYARATCVKGGYTLDPVAGEIRIKSYYAVFDNTYRLGLVESNFNTGRAVEIFVRRMAPPFSTLPQVEMLIAASNATSTANQCYLLHVPGASRMIELYDNGGQNLARNYLWNPTPAVVNPQTQAFDQQRLGAGMARNSQCMVDYTYAWQHQSISVAPYERWNMPVYFEPSFVGPKVIKYRISLGTGEPWTTMQEMAPWNVPNLPNNPPTGQIQSPAEGATVSGTVPITGWALDNATHSETAISNIKVYLDGNYLGAATRNQPGTGCQAYPGRPGCENGQDRSGFHFALDTTQSTVSAGQHLLELVLFDSDTPVNLRTVLTRTITVNK